jgi:hypothetical protein
VASTSLPRLTVPPTIRPRSAVKSIASVPVPMLLLAAPVDCPGHGARRVGAVVVGSRLIELNATNGRMAR